MGCEELWKALADLINEFRKKGETIPSDIMTDLRAAKTLLQLLKLIQTVLTTFLQLRLILATLNHTLL
jgi:hypothetical protein